MKVKEVIMKKAIVTFFLLILPLISYSHKIEVKQYIGTFNASAYEPSARSCGKWAKYHRTKTGIKPHKGVIAVDPLVIPLHTKLYVEHYGYGRAEDVGSKIKGQRVDLFFPYYRDALNFGRHDVKVYTIKIIEVKW